MTKQCIPKADHNMPPPQKLYSGIELYQALTESHALVSSQSLVPPSTASEATSVFHAGLSVLLPLSVSFVT